MRASRRHPGFTLIETLVVVVVLALAASGAAVSLARADDAASLRRAEAAVRHLDRQARLLARTHGPVLLEAGPERTELRVRAMAAPGARQSDDNVILARRALDRGRRAHIVRPSDGRPTRAVRFDRAGRAPDYSVVIRDADRTRRLRITGATGWITHDEGRSP